jgi:isopentenyldiphosphate isomerase
MGIPELISMNQRKTFDGEMAIRRLLRHAYKLEIESIDDEKIATRYHKQAVADLNTLAEEIDVIAKRFGETYDADIEFEVEIDIGEFAEADNES